MTNLRKKLSIGLAILMLVCLSAFTLVSMPEVQAQGTWTVTQGWTATDVDGTTVYTSDPNGSKLDYSGAVDFNKLSMNIKINAQGEYTSNVAFGVITSNYKYMMFYYPMKGQVAAVNETTGAWLNSTAEGAHTATLDTWYNLTVELGADVIRMYFDGNLVVEALTTKTEDFANAQYFVWCWGVNSSIKEVTTSSVEVTPPANIPQPYWASSTWAAEEVEGTTVYTTPTGGTSLDYVGRGVVNFNKISADVATVGTGDRTSNVAYIVRCVSGNRYFIVYYPMMGTIQIKNEVTGVVIATTADGAYPYTSEVYANFSIELAPTVIYVYFNGQKVLEANTYAREDFTKADYLMWSWGIVEKVKNFTTSTVVMDIPAWTVGAGFAEAEGIYTKSELNADPANLTYAGEITKNAVNFDLCFGALIEGTEANVGATITLANGNKYFLELCYGNQHARLRSYTPGENWITYKPFPKAYALTDTLNVTFVYDENNIQIVVDGTPIIAVKDTGAEVFNVTGLQLSTWCMQPTISNVKLVDVSDKLWISSGFEESANDQGETLYNKNISVYDVAALTYAYTVTGLNSLTFDVAYNEVIPDQGNVGLNIELANGNVYFMEMCFGNEHVRLRRYNPGENWVTYPAFPRSFAANEFVNVQMLFEEGLLGVLVNGELILEQRDTFGDSFDGAALRLSSWNTLPTIKNVVLEEVNTNEVIFQSKVNALDLSTDKASIKVSDPSGIRFLSQFNTAEYNALVSYYGAENVQMGTLISAKGKLPEGEELTLANAGLIITCETYFGVNGEYTLFTGVVAEVPATDYNTDIYARAYVKVTVGEAEYVVYAEMLTRSVYGVAKLAYNNEADTVAYQNAVLGAIISAVEGQEEVPATPAE